MPATDQGQERRTRLQGWLQTAAFLGAAAILGVVLYTAFVVQSERRAAERTVTSVEQSRVATATPRSRAPTLEPLDPAILEQLRSTPLPAALLPITADSAAQVAEVARWGRGALRAVAWSPDGEVLAAGTTLGVFLYDSRTLQELRFLDAGGGVMWLAFSPDGQVLAAMSFWSSGQWPQVQQWRVADGQLLETIREIPSTDAAIAFSAEGRLLLAWVLWDGDAIGLWEGGMAQQGSGSLVLVAEGTETRLPIPRSEAGAPGTAPVALSPNGRLVAVGMPDGNVYVRQVADGLLLATLKAAGGPVEHLAFAPNGRFLAAGSSNSGVRLWQVAGGSLLYVLDEGAAVSDLAFSADGRRLAVLGGETTRLYGVDSGALVRVLDIRGPEGASGPAPAPPEGRVAFSPDGQVLAVGVVDGPLLMVRTEDGRLLRSWSGFGQPLVGPALSADGSTLATATYPGGAVWLWDVAYAIPRQVLRSPESPASPGARPPGAFSPDGRLLARAEGSAVTLWRVADGTVAGRVPPVGQDVLSPTERPLCTAFSPDSQWLAVGYERGPLLLWQMSWGTSRWITSEASLWGDAPSWCDLAFSPGGQYLAASWFGSPVYLWQVPEGTAVHQWETECIGGAAFSPDGQLLATKTSFDEIAIWEVASGERRRTLAVPAEGGLGLAFSADGSILAGGSKGGAIFLWRVDDGTLLRTLEGHVGLITGLAFSLDGRRLFSASVDGTVRVWGCVVASR